MAVSSPINMKTFQDAVYSWFYDATELNTAWADQSTPQPEMPFGQLRIMGPAIPDAPYWFESYEDNIVYPDSDGTWGTGGWGTMGWSGASNQEIGTELKIEHSIAARITVQCQVFVGMPDARDPLANANYYMDAATSELQLQTVRSALQTYGISVFDIVRHQNTSALLPGTRDSRALADVIFKAPLNKSEYIGYFSSAHLSSDNDAIELDETIALGE